jgi:secreted PhoX family phosphatase
MCLTSVEVRRARARGISPRSMSSTVGRRAFLRTALAAAAVTSLPISLVFARRAMKSPLGALRRDPDGVLDLPEGFSYRILEHAMGPMNDGYRVPGRPDGMGCFPGAAGTLVLLRNHENYPDQPEHGPYRRGQAPPVEAYDRKAMGAVTRVVVRSDTFERISSNLVLAGTSRNCSGGASPWGWLSCEEDVAPGHGYVFLCRADAASVQRPERITAYGRFNHEGAVVEPSRNVAYLTEDRDDGCLYRFVPDRPDAPFVGKLQALRVPGRDRLPIATALRVGERVPVSWVDVDEPDPKGDTMRASAQAKGAAIVRRGEGITLWRGAIYVCSTTGGPVSGGQILRHRDGSDGGTLEVIAEATDRDELDMPDNITFSPSGELFMAEDGDNGNHVTVLDASGGTYKFARNARSAGEISGVCFSPDGRALFLNLQNEGLTLVVTGPFRRG